MAKRCQVAFEAVLKILFFSIKAACVLQPDVQIGEVNQEN
jgi:hypothetical protein